MLAAFPPFKPGLVGCSLRPLIMATQTQLCALNFFGRPKLALDAVGGDSAVRLADALEQVPPPATRNGVHSSLCRSCSF
jgi:hypothetical protein